MPVDAKRPAEHRAIAAKPLLPQMMSDHHHRTRFACVGALGGQERAAQLGLHAQDAEVIGRHILTRDALWVLVADSEGVVQRCADARLERQAVARDAGARVRSERRQGKGPRQEVVLNSPVGDRVSIEANRSPALTPGKGCTRRASIHPKTVVLAAMPSASVNTVTAAKPGLLPKTLMP